MGQTENAIGILQAVLRSADENQFYNHPYTAKSLRFLGECYIDANEPLEALSAFEKALEVFRLVYKDQDHPQIVEIKSLREGLTH